MEKIYTGITTLVVETDDIENLSQSVCKDLSNGDIVIKLVDGVYKDTYVVSYKDDECFVLTYTDSDDVISVSYIYDEENGWYYDSAQESSLHSIEIERLNVGEGHDGQVPVADEYGDLNMQSISGGTKLYKHELSDISYDDDGNTRTLHLIFVSDSNEKVSDNTTILGIVSGSYFGTGLSIELVKIQNQGSSFAFHIGGGMSGGSLIIKSITGVNLDNITDTITEL